MCTQKDRRLSDLTETLADYTESLRCGDVNGKCGLWKNGEKRNPLVVAKTNTFNAKPHAD